LQQEFCCKSEKNVELQKNGKKASLLKIRNEKGAASRYRGTGMNCFSGLFTFFQDDTGE
jgi:hypothetical protein